MSRQKIGIIGVGAFGEFMLKYLIPYFNVSVYDAHRDLGAVAATYNLAVENLEGVCASDIVILCVPVSRLGEVAQQIRGFIKPGQLVIDLCSVKCLPVKIMQDTFGPEIELLSLHPLFGPQSGKFGIHGMNVALCNINSPRAACVAEFLSKTLGLNVHETTPERHDQEMAYVQGLTHMIAKIFTHMDIPEIHQKTRTYTLLDEMVEMIRYDSEELFNAIQRDNPYVDGTKQKFFEAVKALEKRLAKQAKTGAER